VRVFIAFDVICFASPFTKGSTVMATTTLRVDFISESAAYRSTFGWYNKVTGVGGVLFSDVEAEGRRAPLTAGSSYAEFTVDSTDVGNIEFFLIPNGGAIGANSDAELSGPVKVIQLADGSWAVATLNGDGSVQTGHNGKPNILQGAGANAFFTEKAKNEGGTDHASSTVGSNQTAATLGGDTADGPTGLIAWEDLAATRNKRGIYGNPGDADYNDAVFNVSVVPSGNTPPVAVADSNAGDPVVASGVNPDNTAFPGDPTATGNVLTNDTDADAGDGKTVTTLGAFAGVYGSLTLSANGAWTYTLDNGDPQTRALAQGASASELFSYTMQDTAGATSTATLTITITGTNDAPVVSAAVSGGGAEGSGLATVDLLAFASDVDTGAVLHVEGLVWDEDPGNLPAGFSQSGNSLSVDTDSLAYNQMAEGDTFATHFTYDVVDEHGARVTQHATVTITGTNDAPVISGQAAGSVTEDAPLGMQTSGQLTSTDPDGGPVAWSILGGTTSAQTQDFRFQADNLKIVKNGNLFFEDTFNNGNPPPSAPNIGANPASYSTNGTFTEAGGRIFFDGTESAVFGTTNYGERATLNTDTNNASNPAGLKRNSDFSTEVRFDLILPEDIGDAYGIRLVDQPAPPGNNNSIADLVVLRDATGVHVALRQINVSTSTVTVLQTINLPPGSYDQIVLKFDYQQSSYVDATAGGKVTASFDLLSNGVVTSSASFASQGTIFVGEDFTRVQMIGQSTQAETGVYKLAGTYGTLTMAQDGQWHYLLADHQANVQALTQGQTVIDSFTVQASDGQGGVTSQQIDVTVVGANEAPVISGQTTGSVTEDAPLQMQTSGQLTSTDPDGGPAQWSIVGGTTSAQTQDFRFQADNLRIYKNGNLIIEDTFNDGNPPPAVGAPGAPSYTVQGGVTEAAGRLLFDGTNAIGFGAPVATAIGERVTVNTAADTIDNPMGLKRNSDFSAESRFDLIVPEDNGDSYGMRLTDQNSAPPNNQSTVDLIVTRTGGNVVVALREINLSTSQVTLLETQNLVVGSNDQIVLRLSYDNSSYVNSTVGGLASASFDLLTNGAVTSTTSFTAQGAIFQGEDFTRVQLVGQTAAGNETGVYKLAGIYGTLTVAQDGQWHYLLADHQANVQALAQGQTVVDTFTVQASDGQGGVTNRQINVTVVGTNDAPVAQADFGTVTEDGISVANGNVLLNDSDIEFDFISVSGVAAGNTNTPLTGNINLEIVGTYGSLTMFSSGAWGYQLDNNNPATNALVEGQVVADVFTYTVIDGNGGSANQTVTINVNGADETPLVAQPDSGDVTENGTLLDSDQIIFGNSAANGNVLLNDSGDSISISGLAAGTTNTPIFGNINFAIAGTYGALTIFSDGTWGYQLDNNNPATNALAQGQVVADVFTYTVIDSNGGSANQTITIDVTGANDAPVATQELKLEVLEGSNLHQLDLLQGTADAEGNAIHVGELNGGLGLFHSFLSLNPDGHTLTIDTDDPWFNPQFMGQAIDYQVAYELVDSHGSISHHMATFRVVGTDDAPITVVDGQHVVIAAGGVDPGVATAQMRIFTADTDWIGVAPDNTPIQQPVFANTTGWTANGGGTWSKTGIYGTLVWDPTATSEWGTLTYHLDNNDLDTLALDSSDNVYDSFEVTYTDGTLSTTRIANFEVVGRDDMYGEELHWDVMFPTIDYNGTVPGYPTNFSASFVVGDQMELTGAADADVDLTRDQINISWHAIGNYPSGGNYLGSDGVIHSAPPAPGDTWTVTTIYFGTPFNGFRVSDLPTLDRVDLAIGSTNVPPVHWDGDTMWVDNQNQFYPAGSEQTWILTFQAGTPIVDFSVNPNPGFVDVGATNESIGPTVTVHDGFTFNLNVAYDGTVDFQGPTGTLKFETTDFTGAVENFVSANDEYLDFSAVTLGNADIVGEISGSTLDAHSIGWVTDGDDTTVYVNAGDNAASIGSGTDMAVLLINVTQLNNNDFIL
jgi:VCBS repeat-containing protein